MQQGNGPTFAVETKDGRADMSGFEMDLLDTKMGTTPRTKSPGRRDQRVSCRNTCLRPACFPISIIVIFIVMVVLFPVLNEDFWNGTITPWEKTGICNDSCKFEFVESIPENLTYPPGSPSYPSTYSAWIELLKRANKTVDMAVFYWSLNDSQAPEHPSSWQGVDVLRQIQLKGASVKIRIVQSLPSDASLESANLALQNLAEVRNISFPEWFGSGVLHTKFWIVDDTHFYVGSANMDWRSLTQVKEMGAVVYDCPCLAQDLKKIFEVYWIMADPTTTQIPTSWPQQLWTTFNATTPLQVALNKSIVSSYLSSAPPQFCPKRREPDLSAILDVISKAKKFVHIAVMDYYPTTLYMKSNNTFWPYIDDALRAAAFNNKIEVKLLASNWSHTYKDMFAFLRSLQEFDAGLRTGGSIQVKIFNVPASPEQANITYARVNHNKYMVTDNTAYVGTSNWAGDYFISTGGVGIIVAPPASAPYQTPVIASQLAAVFSRDWNSTYATPLSSAKAVDCDPKEMIEERSDFNLGNRGQSSHDEQIDFNEVKRKHRHEHLDKIIL